MKAAVLAPYYNKSKKLIEIVESTKPVGSWVSKLVKPDELQRYLLVEFYDQADPTMIIYPAYFSPEEVRVITTYDVSKIKRSDASDLSNISKLASDKDKVILITPDKSMHELKLR